MDREKTPMETISIEAAGMRNELVRNIDKLHTTEMGEERIRRNLSIEADDVVSWCKMRILDKSSNIERKGKNWYAAAGDCIITVNAHSYTIITAHKLKGVMLTNLADAPLR